MTKQKEVDMAKSEFLSLASHQLRTPISAIKWNLELLMSDKSQNITTDQQTYLEKISRNTEKMKTLVQDFLDASQLDMGSFAGKPVDIEVNSWLKQVCEEFADRIAEKSINLKTTFPADTCVIHTDEHLLHNALSNLISNAIKYTPAEGDVCVKYVTTATDISFTVSDTGIGIPEAEQAKLFGKFFRASNAQENSTEGTGLGLYIAKRAIDEIGGTVTVSSKMGAGTSFVITIPRNQKS